MVAKRSPYGKKELYAVRPPRALSGSQLNEVAFPLGGIGTGSIALSGRGQLIDWEIFNKPEKGYRPEFAFFSLWARQGKAAPVFRVLEERQPPPYHGEKQHPYESGPLYRNAAGLPRLRKAVFTGAFPWARIDYRDPALPVRVSLNAFSPFIPSNDKDSSLPVAVFDFTLANSGKETVAATLAFNLQNRCGHPHCDRTVNRFVDAGGYRGISMSTARYTPEETPYATMMLASPWPDATWTCQWPRVGGMGGLQHFCNTFARTGRFDDDEPLPPAEHWSDTASLGLPVRLKPGASATLTLIIAWHAPWFEQYWTAEPGCCASGQTCAKPRWKNYYATVWPDAEAVTAYTVEHLVRLREETVRFADALHGSTLPAVAIDAASSQLAILRSTTSVRLEDGTFYGWEGSAPNRGCCQGTCTHVWNYAQALPYLFPRLERSIRDSHFAYDLRESDGHMQFRMPLPLGSIADHQFHAAADGQLGDVMKVYREYLIGGDLDWLKGLWPRVKRALEYAWVEWDKDQDGVIEGVHHNTYDIEFHGSEPLAQSFYLGALRAGEEMARLVGDDHAAAEYRRVYQQGRAKSERLLWNGEYFIQRMDADKDTRFQFGAGCLADQLIGQWYARMLGLGDLWDPAKVKRALRAVFAHNWKADLSDHLNPQRVYALNDDAGLLLCTWPRGGRPLFPFFYSDEVWTGIEYQVASHMIYEGLVDEGLAIVAGVRRRHDGERRNPWNEFECGNHYARAMASWAVLLALAGFSCDMAQGRLGFAPRMPGKSFQCFFAVDGGWGVLRRNQTATETTAEVHLLYGALELSMLDVGGAKARKGGTVTATLNGKAVPTAATSIDGGARVTLGTPVALGAGDKLRARLR